MTHGNRLRRVLAAVSAPLLAATLLAACGDDDDDDTGGGAGTTPAETDGTSGGGAAAELPDLSGQTIDVLAKWSGGEQENFEQVLARFEELTGADVTYTSGGDATPTVLTTAIEGGNPPDVAVLPQPGLMVDLVGTGDLIPIEDAVGALVDANYSAEWRDLGSVDGELYGVWFKAGNKSTVWYRTDLFEAAGVEPPTDWEGFLEVAQTIADSGVTPVSIGGADGWSLTDWFENVYVQQAGPDMYRQLATHEIPWTDPSVTAALETLAEVWGNPDLVSGGTETALQNDVTASVTRTFSPDDEAAIVYESDFVAGVIADNTDFTPGEDADYFPFPAIEQTVPTVLAGGDVAVMLVDGEGPRALMQFLASPESAEVWAPLGGFLSANSGVDPSAYPNDVARRVEQLVGAEALVFDMSDLQPAAFGATEGQGMWGLFQEFLADPSDVDGTQQALEDAAAQAYGS